MARRDSAASRSSSSSRAGGRAARPRTDGKVEVSCPQCAATYRIGSDALDAKIECQECHRVFFAKTAVGKRAKPPDYTKVYVGFGIGAVALIGIFMAMSGGTPPAKPKTTAAAPTAPTFSRGSHPRAIELRNWARAIGDNNEQVISTYCDLPAVASKLGCKADAASVVAAMQSSDETKYFRELTCDSAELASDADMDSATGKATIYLTPKTNDKLYLRNTRGEFEVTFRTEGSDIRVTGWEMKMRPNRDPKHAEPSKGAYVVDKNIAKPETATVTDSAGTRTVQESKPGPMPHWEKATPAQQAMADEVVADVLKSADPEARGGLLTRATLKAQTKEDKQSVVPRLLNAMNDCYADVNANNMKLSQLNRALVAITGFAVNYQVADSGDTAKDKKERESCVRQWFAFWWKYNGDLSKFFDTRDNLEEPLEDPAKPGDPAKPADKKTGK